MIRYNLLIPATPPLSHYSSKIWWWSDTVYSCPQPPPLPPLSHYIKDTGNFGGQNPSCTFYMGYEGRGWRAWVNLIWSPPDLRVIIYDMMEMDLFLPRQGDQIRIYDHTLSPCSTVYTHNMLVIINPILCACSVLRRFRLLTADVFLNLGEFLRRKFGPMKVRHGGNRR